MWVLPFEMGIKAGEEKLILPDRMHLTRALAAARAAGVSHVGTVPAA
jgi:hypothetical protein